MKIGIMGGTFDPIHNGHLMLGDTARDQFGLDVIWFMPNGRPPHKALDSIGSDTDSVQRWWHWLSKITNHLNYRTMN